MQRGNKTLGISRKCNKLKVGPIFEILKVKVLIACIPLRVKASQILLE